MTNELGSVANALQKIETSGEISTREGSIDYISRRNINGDNIDEAAMRDQLDEIEHR